MARLLALAALLGLTACAAPPDLPPRELTAEERASMPVLIDLNPIFSSPETLEGDRAAEAGLSLEARAALLRRRADQLRAMPLN